MSTFNLQNIMIFSDYFGNHMLVLLKAKLRSFIGGNHTYKLTIWRPSLTTKFLVNNHQT